MSERLVTERELEGVLRRLAGLEQWRDRNKVEVPICASGTWTPALFGDGATPGTFTYDAANTGGEYTRIGNRVLFNGRVRATATTTAPTGNVYITLPSAFTVASPTFSTPVGGAPMLFWTGVTFSAGRTMLSGYVVSATARLYLIESAAQANVQGAALAAAFDFGFAGEYRIA